MAQGRPHSFLHVSRPDIDLPDHLPGDSPEGLALAARAFGRLQADGLLVRDRSPAFHAYRLTRGAHRQTGVVGVADLGAYASGRIRRHELTTPAKQADRVAHMEALDAQTGPVFVMHRPSAAISDALGSITQAPAPTSVTGPGGVVHELWPIDDPQQIDSLVASFEALDALYIADGHHRSAAAWDVHQRRQSDTSGGFLAVAFPTDQVQILPYNRLVRAPEGMASDAVLAALAGRVEVQPADTAVVPTTPGQFGLYLDRAWYRLSLSTEMLAGLDPVSRLDATLLQTEVLAPVFGIDDPRTDQGIGFVGGTRPLSEMEAAVDSGAWTAAVSMHATSVDDLLAVSDAGMIMPPKSTWFEPKLLDGLVSHLLT